MGSDPLPFSTPGYRLPTIGSSNFNPEDRSLEAKLRGAATWDPPDMPQVEYEARFIEQQFARL